MKNKTKTTKKKLPFDPVLEVEEWKDAVDRETQGMTEKQMNQYYNDALRLIKPDLVFQNN